MTNFPAGFNGFDGDETVIVECEGRGCEADLEMTDADYQVATGPFLCGPCLEVAESKVAA